MRKGKIRKQMVSWLLMAGLVFSGVPTSVFASGYGEETVSEKGMEAPADLAEKQFAQVASGEETEPVQEEAGEAEQKEEMIPAEDPAAEESGEEEVTEEVTEEITEEEETEGMEAGTESVVCEAPDPESGSFKIRVKGVTLSAGDAILVPVWQDAKQKDIVWNTAKPEGQDYVVQETVAAHQYLTGEYQIHVYKRSRTGEMTFLAKTTQMIKPEAAALTASQVQGQLEAVLTGVKVYGCADSVKVAVWSDVNGQDDLDWTDVKRQADGSWKAMVPLSKHAGAGVFHVHAYAFTKTGQPIFLQKAQCTIGASLSGSVEVTEVNQATGEFTVTVSNLVAPSGISVIQVPIWCAADQSDIYWYTAVKQGDSYVVKGNFSKHGNHTGTYQIHVYLTDTTGYRSFLVKTTMKSEVAEPQIGDFSAEVTGGKFTLCADRVITPFPLSSVIIAVWSKADQSDLIWYTAAKEGDRYVVSSSIEKHSNHTGTYQAHLYLVGTDGKLTFGSKTSFTAALKYSALVAASSDHEATFQISLSDFQEGAGSASVQFAVWSEENGQDDIKWYAGSQSGSNYTATVAVKNHRGLGTYQVHAYVFWPDNSCTFIGKTTFTVTKMEANILSTEAISADSVRITLRNPVLNGKNAASVTFPTWTETNGQDDLVWYKGVKQTDGSYQVVVKAENHKHSGKYITHVYVSDGSSQGIAGATEYILNKPVSEVREFDAEARAVMRKIIYAVETGGQVYGRQRYDAFTEAYTNSSGEAAITIGAGQWYATEAKRLLTLIKEQYPATFVQYDTAGIAADLVNADWRYYGTDGAGHRTILKGSEKAVAIQNIISSAGGIAVQDSLVDEQMVKYADQAKALGVTDLKARLFCANIQHLGGYNAMVRIINYCKNDGDALTMENLWTNMRQREAGSGNYVGSDLYASRHQKVMQWLNTYL